MCRTSRGKQIKAITFAFISGARNAQTPLWFTEYPEHVNNSYCNRNSLLLGGLVGWLVFNHLPFCNHTCCVPTGAPFLVSTALDRRPFPSYSHHGSSAHTGLSNVFGRVTMETAGCVFTFPSVCSSLSSLFLLHRIFPPCSIFLPGSGDQCPSCQCPSPSIHSVHGISRSGEISGQSVYPQLCQISQMLGGSRIVLGSLQNPARLRSQPCPTAQSFQPW